MWSTVANLKENLNKIALDVHYPDDDEDDVVLSTYGSPANGENPAISDRRNSLSFADTKLVPRSPVANGIDSPFASEVYHYFAYFCA